MQHPTYRAFQARTASLSLFPNVYIKFLPPSWNAPTPSSYVESDSLQVEDSEAKLKKEWKRRIKMFRESLPFVGLSFSQQDALYRSGSHNGSVWILAHHLWIFARRSIEGDLQRWRLV